MQGLLCGAAVGAGFAIPESIQYFLIILLQCLFDCIRIFIAGLASGNISSDAQANQFWAMAFEHISSESLGNSYLRAIFAPFGHMLYTPIVAAALWRIMEGKSFTFALLADFRFIRLGAVGVLLHAFWNSPILMDDSSWLLKLGIICIVGWSVIFLLIHEGVARLRTGKPQDAGRGA